MSLGRVFYRQFHEVNSDITYHGRLLYRDLRVFKISVNYMEKNGIFPATCLFLGKEIAQIRSVRSVIFNVYSEDDQ